MLCYGYVSPFDRKYANNSDGQDSSRQGSSNNLLCCYRPKHLTMNLLSAHEEGDKMSEDEGFDRDGNVHDGGGNKHD
eukprot:9512775-Ditylum_brightwellii.AAC.1